MVVAIAVALALGALAITAIRTLIQARDASTLRQTRFVEAQAHALAADLDRELDRAYLWFTPWPAGFADRAHVDGDWPQFRQSWQVWRDRAPLGDLIQQWYAAVDLGDGLQVWRFDAARRRFIRAEWPTSLASVAARMAHEHRDWQDSDGDYDGGAPPLMPPHHGPALVIALDGPPFAYLVGVIDVDYLLTGPIRAWSTERFGPDYTVAIKTADGRPLYPRLSAGASEANSRISRTAVSADAVASADAAAPLLRVSIKALGDTLFGEPSSSIPAWRLEVRHRAGSVAAAVAERYRLSLLLVILALMIAIAGGIGLAIGIVRTLRLARTQTAFVAGVSHDLRTPLAVIGSAAENLRDGVVTEPEQVAEYGDMIVAEGRRLSTMVEDALAIAAHRKGRPERATDVDVDTAVRAAASRARAQLQHAGMVV